MIGGLTNQLQGRTIFGEAGMRDAAGNQLSYRYEQHVMSPQTGAPQRWMEQTYTTAYALFDDYKQGTVTVSKNNAGPLEQGFGRSTFLYTARGKLLQTKVPDANGALVRRSFTSNGAGQVISRIDGITADHPGLTESQFYYDGAPILKANWVEGPEVAGGFESVEEAQFSNTPTSYTTRAGDTEKLVPDLDYHSSL